MRYQYLLFDLDGTITDPKEGITKSAQYALEAFGIHEPDARQADPLHRPAADRQLSGILPHAARAGRRLR